MNPLLLTEQEPARRGFLRSLILAPAAALATHRLILPGETTPEERARRAWSEFSAAMREISVGADGWKILGAGDVKPLHELQAASWLSLALVHYENANDPRCPKLIIERHTELTL
jgi:hypothetical protein